MKLRSGRSVITFEDRPIRQKIQKVETQEQERRNHFRILSNPFPKLFGDIKTSRESLSETSDLSVGRCFIIVQYNESCHQLFYRSSGHNTHYPQTWFPTNGYLLDYMDGGYYDKLSNTKFTKRITKDEGLHKQILELKRPFLNSIEAINSTVLYRFGTRQFMYISYLLGGSLWQDVELTAILSQHFQLPMNHPQQQYQLPIPPRQIQNIYQDVNWFAKDAISTNYCKEEYDSVNDYVNYHDWYTKLYTIGENSPQLKAIRKFVPTQANLCVNKPLYIVYENQKFLLLVLVASMDQDCLKNCH
jgi:hypothetical protein